MSTHFATITGIHGRDRPAAAVELRGGTIGDAAAAGVIGYQAFRAIAERHGFPPDFPSLRVATGQLESLFGRADVYT